MSHKLILVAWTTILAVTLMSCGNDVPAEPEPAHSTVPEEQSDVGDEAIIPSEDITPAEAQLNPSTGELLPAPFSVIWQPWIGDYDGMVERRIIRVLVPYGGYQFYYDQGAPRGAVYELVQRFESHINEQLGRRNIKVYVVVIPVSRDELLPALLAGHADFVAADLTLTEARLQHFDFTRPLLTEIDEVVVTGPAAPPLDSLDDLAGQEIFVRHSSSYYEHLQKLADSMEQRGLQRPRFKAADELLEAEDILDVLNAGMFGVTVMDDYKAKFWADVFPDIVVRDDLVVNQGGEIGWALRKDSPELAKVVDGFLREFGKGTLIGNYTFNRSLEDASRVRCAETGLDSAQKRRVTTALQTYADIYEFDWLMLAAQAFQESGFRQDRRSPAGAIGIMQIKPSTAADRNVGIPDISTVDNNVHAGTKYLRFLADRYFDNDEINDLNQWLLSLAAYNAGPARIARLRREAGENGYDANLWFNNVEIFAARRIGRETVTYVSNIFKYYVGYQIISERKDLREERYASELAGCASESIS